jgi:hypothetical protein
MTEYACNPDCNAPLWGQTHRISNSTGQTAHHAVAFFMDALWTRIICIPVRIFTLYILGSWLHLGAGHEIPFSNTRAWLDELQRKFREQFDRNVRRTASVMLVTITNFWFNKWKLESFSSTLVVELARQVLMGYLFRRGDTLRTLISQLRYVAVGLIVKG